MASMAEVDAQIESLADQLLSLVARRYYENQRRGIFGEFSLNVAAQDGSLSHFGLELKPRFKPAKKN